MNKIVKFYLNRTDIKEVLKVADNFCSSWEPKNDPLCYKFKLIFEELVVNVFNYSIKLGATYLEIKIKKLSKGVELELFYDGEGFDPTNYKAEELSKPLQDKRKGGIGIFLVSRFSKEFSYKREENTNKLHIQISN